MELEYKNILDSIQDTVDEICNQIYGDDTDSPPKFIVSLYQGYKDGEIVEHQIILTIDHMNIKHSRPLFPRLDYKYGYESLSEAMKYLYNSTM